MAAKEPTVERRHRLLAFELNDATEEQVAQALAAAEQTASERAWDEGWQAGAVDSEEAGYKRTENPYRLPKGPTK